MIRTLATEQEYGFDWIDLVDPDKDELHKIASDYNLHESSVQDCLQPDHLPKYEIVGNYTFYIFRVFTPDISTDADTVQELTNKIAIFISNSRIITLRRYEWMEIELVKEMHIKNNNSKTVHLVLNEIIRQGLLTFDEPATKLTKAIEKYETNVFLKDKKKIPLLKGLYFIKRKVDVIRRILILSYEIIDKIDGPESSNTYTRDTRDLYLRLQNVYDSLSANTNHLLQIYFSISSQRTNEIIRVLTIFSVFFMPLTFIVGIYGMNFDFMPELRWKLGYPGIIFVMAVITFCIYLWFKRKDWL
jgi:magnesium transporter